MTTSPKYSAWLRQFSKVDFTDYKRGTIRRRILRRMAVNRIDTIQKYVDLLHRSPIEVAALYQDMLILVTSFFRNPESFRAVKEVVYPIILQNPGRKDPVRIWVVGCSSGEEAYSHAINIVEYLDENHLHVPVQIFGTDLSQVAIQRARAGVYKPNILADVSTQRLRRYFNKVEGGYQISKSIRDMCIFSIQNVVKDPPFSRMDLVSCRNLLIYLGPILQRRVIPILHYALNPAGFLMIGNTEGLLGAGAELFDITDRKHKIYRKKLLPSPVSFGFTVTQEEVATRDMQPTTPDKHTEPKPPLEVLRESDRLLLALYAPPAVVISPSMEILQTRGHTGPFLELPTGKATLNLFKMAKPGLLHELQNAIEAARSAAAEVSRDSVRLESNGQILTVKLRVMPFKAPFQDQFSFIVIFEEKQQTRTRPEAETASSGREAHGEADERDAQIAQLRQELDATKDYLQSIIESQEATNEELQSANEEIQSSNEELQSTNEELQTSKEELESANEELNTVNEELQHRNQLLTELNNDLVNVLNSVGMPVIILGADLSLRRFTPQAEELLGFTDSDVGRALPRLRLKINMAELEKVMLKVMRDVTAIQEDVQDEGGVSYRLRITPYRTMDNKIDGIILTLVNNLKTKAQNMAQGKEAKSRTRKREK